MTSHPVMNVMDLVSAENSTLPVVENPPVDISGKSGEVEVIEIDDDSADSSEYHEPMTNQQAISPLSVTEPQSPIREEVPNNQVCPMIENLPPATIKLPTASYDEPFFKFGPYIPLIRRDNGIFVEPEGIIEDFVELDQNPLSKQLTRELLPEDSILEAPSLVTPLLVKKRTKWPFKVTEQSSDSNSSDPQQEQDDSLVCERMFNSQGSTQIVTVLFNQPSASNFRKNDRQISDYMRSATVLSLTHNKLENPEVALSIKDFQKSSVSDMLIGLGLSRVMEYKLDHDVRRLASKIKRSVNDCAQQIEQLESLRDQLSQTRASNEPFKSKDVFKCPHCPFNSDSRIVLEGHLEVPHPSKKRELACNWCDQKFKDFNSIAFHCLKSHRKRWTRIEKPIPSLTCLYCPFESSSKKRMLTHLNKCQQSFSKDHTQDTRQFYLDGPPTVTSKPITRDDIIMYEQTLKDLRLSVFAPHQVRVGPTSSNPMMHTLLVLPKATSAPRFNLNQPAPVRHPFAITQNEHPFIRPLGIVTTANNSTNTGYNEGK